MKRGTRIWIRIKMIRIRNPGCKTIKAPYVQEIKNLLDENQQPAPYLPLHLHLGHSTNETTCLKIALKSCKNGKQEPGTDPMMDIVQYRVRLL